MKTNKQGYITDFIEKSSASEVDHWKSEVPQEMKEQGKEYLASMGVYLLDRKQLAGLFNDHLEDVETDHYSVVDGIVVVHRDAIVQRIDEIIQKYYEQYGDSDADMRSGGNTWWKTDHYF